MMKYHYVVLGLATATLTLGGCSQSASVPALQPHAISDSLAKATFTMHWPTASASASARRDYVSASTQSISVQVNSLAPIIVNRPSSASVPTSSIVMAAPAGTDVIAFKLYDQDGAAGNLLGEAAVSQAISNDTVNVVNATINGVLGKIAVGPNSNQPFIKGNQLKGFVLTGEVSETLIATPEDTDGNVIVAPGTVPTITIASGSSAVSASAGSSANHFTVAAATPVSGPVTLTFAGTGTTISQTVTVTESAAIYVPNINNSTITVYDQTGAQITPTGTFPNLDLPAGVALDPANGDLYVTNYGNSSISVYTQNGSQVTPSGTFPNLNQPEGIAYDPINGDLYVTNVGNSTITVYNQNGGQIATNSETFANLNFPIGITFDTVNSDFYVTNNGSNAITVYDAAGNSVATTGTFPNLANPSGILFDPLDGEIYVTGTGGTDVYDQNGAQVTPSGGFLSQRSSIGIVLNPLTSDLFVANSGINTITEYDQNGNSLGSTTSPAFPNLDYPFEPTLVP